MRAELSSGKPAGDARQVKDIRRGNVVAGSCDGLVNRYCGCSAWSVTRERADDALSYTLLCVHFVVTQWRIVVLFTTRNTIFVRG